jgi:predicted nucleotidyltransferase
MIGERRVPQGAIGRVVSSAGDRVEVRVVGVGVLTYARDEILPRKIGQASFALRRAEGWEALARCRVLEAIVGSRAWGLAEEGSDHDLRGVFALPLVWSSGLFEPPHDLVSADASTTYWELKKAVRQALRADPNTLEMLFVSSVRALDPIGEWILAERSAFVSSQIYGSFGRYALSQLAKLSQSLRLAEHRAIVLEWLRADPDLTLDETARKLATETHEDLLRTKEYIKQLYRSLYDQGLIEERAFPALVAYAKGATEQFDLPRELRPKNAYNLLRLIRSAIDWLETGEPRFVVEGAFRDRLLRIKRGDVPLDEVIAEANEMTPMLEEARTKTRLAEKADLAAADRLLRKIGIELARRHVEKEPGPFGTDAPEPGGLDEEIEDE